MVKIVGSSLSLAATLKRKRRLRKLKSFQAQTECVNRMHEKPCILEVS